MSPAIHPAPIQLAELAAAMRPDWDRQQLDGAIAAARTGGWSWPKVFAEVSRLLLLDDGTPRDLTEAARDPLRRGGQEPGAYERGLAATRQAMARDGAA